MEVTADFGANVTLSDRIALQTLDTWQGFVHKTQDDICFGHNSAELYFEVKDMDSFTQKLTEWPQIEYLHPLKEHSWGQRVLRFYDLDRHIVEVGEDIIMVVRRFVGQGMSPEQTAKRMDVPLSYVISCLDQGQ